MLERRVIMSKVDLNVYRYIKQRISADYDNNRSQKMNQIIIQVISHLDYKEIRENLEKEWKDSLIQYLHRRRTDICS